MEKDSEENQSFWRKLFLMTVIISMISIFGIIISPVGSIVEKYGNIGTIYFVFPILFINVNFTLAIFFYLYNYKEETIFKSTKFTMIYSIIFSGLSIIVSPLIFLAVTKIGYQNSPNSEIYCSFILVMIIASSLTIYLNVLGLLIVDCWKKYSLGKPLDWTDIN